MTRRILWIELRRSAVLATLVSVAVVVLSAPQAGAGLTAFVAGQREGLSFLLVVTLGVGAARARRDRRSRMPELLATTARPQWQRLLLTAAALGIGSVTGYLVGFAGVAVYAAAIGAYLPLNAFVAGAATVPYLAVGLWLGLAVGRALPFAIVPPLLAVAGFVATVVLFIWSDLEGYQQAGRPAPANVLLNPLQREGLEAFETLTPRAQLAQVVWAVALAATCLLLYVATRYARLAAVLPVGLGLVAGGSLLPPYVADAVVPDLGALALVCTPDQPRVCVPRAHHPRTLDHLRGAGREALSILAAKLPQAPTSVVEVAREDLPGVPRPEPDPAILFVDAPTEGVRGSRRDLLWTLLMGAGTLECADQATVEQADREVVARLIAAAWLLDEEPQTAAGEYAWVAELPDTGPAYRDFAALPPDRQRAGVAALRGSELACDGRDRLDLLAGAG